MKMRLSGKTALVTGAGEGIGRAVADLFARNGAAVGIVDIDGDSAEQAAADLMADGVRAAAAVCDVADEAAVAAAVNSIATAIGPPNVLVNNAATFVIRGVEATPEEWQRSLGVNVVGPALVTKHVLPHMRAAGGGSIVNIASVSAFRAQRSFLAYSASKGAVLAMTRCLALDLQADNVRVNAVSPGAVWSASVERMAAREGFTREQAGERENLGKESILGRIADCEEIAAAVLFLASDEASYITGENLMADGGWSAR